MAQNQEDAMRRSQRKQVMWLWAGLVLALAGPRHAIALPVVLHAIEASLTNAPAHPLAQAVDGNCSPDNGWTFTEGQFNEQYAVFATDKPLAAAFCQLQFSFLSPVTNAHFGDFEVDVTSDERPGIKGRWLPLIPETGAANCPEGVRIFGATTRIETQCGVAVVTLRARVPFSGITGIRLRFFAATDDPAGKHPRAIGCAPDGTFILTEFRVETDPQRTSNIALGRQVYCSHAVAAGLPSRNLTDGFFSTYSHPAPTAGTNVFFELDLGRLVRLDHIVIRGREDGTEDDRCGAYRVELLTESGGFEGRTQWAGIIRGNGARLPVGGADVIRTRDGTGEFAGRRIRIYNHSGLTSQPQISEIEVYPALQPFVQEWLADGRVLRGAEGIMVPARTRELSFNVTCTNSAFVPNSLLYRWRLPGRDNIWRETSPEGRATIAPPLPPGQFKLELQACHSDGEWAEAVQSIPFIVAAPWWQNPRSVAMVIGAGMLLVAAGWWRIYTLRMNRRLALAQRNVELHRERLRIARDMHDEMGARLTYIALLADRTRREKDAAVEARDEQLQGLADSARSAVAALDGIVWAVNPGHDTVGDLVDYLCEYAGSYLKPIGIECSFDFKIAEPKRPLTLAIRHELLMAVKEALQNVVKHAHATAVCLACRDAGGRLEILVEDDGCGLEQAASGRDRSGLLNMRRRLTELGGQCEISVGAHGSGTRVSFSIELDLDEAKKK
jgi:signal transduction histidine kinase